MTYTTPRPDCRRLRPPVELGVLMTVGGVPVILARVRDPQIVRGAVQTAIQAAMQRDGVAARQEAQMLTGLLAEI